MQSTESSEGQEKHRRRIAAGLAAMIGVSGWVFSARQHKDNPMISTPSTILAEMDKDKDKLAEILVNDPGARKRWEEIKETMKAIEERAVAEPTSGVHASIEAKEWTKKWQEDRAKNENKFIDGL